MRHATAAAVLAALVAGVAVGVLETAPDRRVIERVAVVPPYVRGAPGDTVTFRGHAYDALGREVVPATFHWFMPIYPGVGVLRVLAVDRDILTAVVVEEGHVILLATALPGARGEGR